MMVSAMMVMLTGDDVNDADGVDDAHRDDDGFTDRTDNGAARDVHDTCDGDECDVADVDERLSTE